MSDTHKCYISFKTQDMRYKEHIQSQLPVDMIDKSLDTPINSNDTEYIMKKIREEYLYDSTVTIFLIGEHSAENITGEDQSFIKRELQASLYDNEGNGKRNGILGIVLPEMTDKIYKGSHHCDVCGGEHNTVVINDTTTIKEFSYNYYIPETKKCAWFPEDRYCILVSWDEFCEKPNYYIDEAFNKRTDPVVKYVKVFP